MTSTEEWKEIFGKIVDYQGKDYRDIKTIEDVKEVFRENKETCHKHGKRDTLTAYHHRNIMDIYYNITQQQEKVKHQIRKQTIYRGKHKQVTIYRNAKGQFMKKPQGY